MRTLQLISSYGFYGAENVALELSKGLASLQVKNVIGVFDNSQNPHVEIAQRAGEEGIPATLFSCNGRVDLTTIFSIIQYIKKNNIDVIHAHGYKSNIYGFIAAKLTGKPIVATCHNWIADDSKTKNYYRIEKAILRWFDKIIAVSGQIEEELARHRVCKNKIKLICNGVEVKKNNAVDNTARKEFNIHRNNLVVGTVARFTAEKGLFNLLHAAKKVVATNQNILLLLVGEGPLKADLENESNKLGLRNNVIFTGRRNDMARMYAAMDIFVLPSLREGLPMVILEAMAAQLPIVATQVGAIPKVLENGKDGILVKPNQIDELSEALLKLMRDASLAKSLAASAFSKVEREFSSRRMCDEYLAVYHEVLNRRLSAPLNTNVYEKNQVS